MEDKEETKKDANDTGPKMKKMMQGFFNDDMKKDFKGMKDDATKGLKPVELF